MTPAAITAIDAGALFALLDPPSEQEKNAHHQQAMTNFARYIQAEKQRLVIPAPAISEYLAYFADEADANRQMAIINKNLDIAPTDSHASFIAAQLWFKVGARTFRQEMKVKGFDISKQCVKVDLLIIATAKAYGAAQLIAEDKGVREACAKIGLPCYRIDELKIPEDKPKKLPPSMFD